MKKITKKWDKEGKRPVVLLDYDDVLFDFLGTVIDEYNRITRSNLRVDDIKSWDLSEFGDIHVFMDIIRDANLWNRMPEKNNSMRVVQKLINDGRWSVYIITACTTLLEYVTKVHIIEEKLPGFDTSKILSCTDKHLIRGDILVDDKLENLESCHPYMHCVLLDMPHNRNSEAYQRIKTLNSLPKLLEDLFCY